jgi:hypothetical protein
MPQERRDAILDLWVQGMDGRAISVLQDGLHPDLVERVALMARRKGDPRGVYHRKQAPYWPENGDEELLRLRAEGWSYGKIAVKLSTTKNAVIGRHFRIKRAARCAQ